MDSARTALRLGADDVYIVYRRSKKELPARIEEVHHAEEEGIQFHFLTLPVEILGNEDGWVCGMKCQRMELGEPDESGRRRPIPVPGSEFTLEVDMVVVAIGTGANPLIPSTTSRPADEQVGLHHRRSRDRSHEQERASTREGIS